LLKAVMQQLHLPTQAYHQVLKLARTIIDLAESEMILANHVAEAVQYRPRMGMRAAKRCICLFHLLLSGFEATRALITRVYQSRMIGDICMLQFEITFSGYAQDETSQMI